MKKNYSSNYMISKMFNLNRLFATALVFVFVFLFQKNSFSQTSTEQFETESNGSSTFTDNGVIFNIISNVNTYDIQAAYPGTGWNGAGAADNRYIDNSGAGNQSAGTSFSIKTTSNLFKVNRFWVFAAAGNGTLGVAGTLTITGKLSGVTKFTQTKTTDFTATTGTANGYTLIDMTNLNGQNYSNIVIDQLQITAGGNFQYLGFDAFTWVKDAGQVLPVKLTDFNASLSKTGVLKADWKTASEQNNSHFIVQSSVDGKVWKDLGRKDAVENATTGATYHFETNIGIVSMAGFGILGILLLPFSKRNRNRYRYLAMLAVIAVVITSCAKDKNELMSIKGISGGSSDNGTIYVRLAQVDLDGTTTYSDVVSVKAK